MSTGAVVTAATLALAACTTTPTETPEGDTDAPVEGGTVTIAEVNELSSFNPATATGNVDINGQIEYLTQSGFFRLNDVPEVVYDESFGNVELVSEDPLVVTYTINEDQVWSDGEPIDADDMLLSILASTAYYDDATLDDAGEVESGNAYFATAASAVGTRLAGFPEIGEDGRSMTIEYETPYADWALFNPVGVPAHVVAENAGAEGGQAMVDLLSQIPQGDVESPAEESTELRAIADFWNTGFDAASLPSDESLYLASGPYVVSAWSTGQSVTLDRNPEYNGDLEPAFDQVVVQFIADATAQVQALQNGEVDIVNPQSSADTLQSLEAVSGATVLTGDTGSYDHIDLNFDNEVFADPAVREAFLLTIPRDQVLDSIIRPLDPEAELLDSQLFFPGVPGYEEAVAANNSAQFAEPDIERAIELLDGQTPTVRIAYNNANPNRLDTYNIIAASAAEAGFEVVDGGLGAQEWGAALSQSGTWDAFIFGWSTVGVGVAGVPQLYDSGSASNFGGWSNPEADAVMAELVTTVDPDEQVAQQVEVDTAAWADFFGLPLFVSPGVIASGPNIEGVEYSAWQTGPIWNFWEWTPAG